MIGEGQASTSTYGGDGVPDTPSAAARSASDTPAVPTATDPIAAGLPAAAPTAPGQPAVIAAVPGEDKHPGARPEGLMTARDNRADDLKRIRGIGPQNEGRLHGLGIWHFDQIGAWTPENVRWVGSYLAFPGRIDRETWVEQAKVLATGGDTEFSRRVRAGKVATKHDDGTFGQANIATDLTPRKPR